MRTKILLSSVGLAVVAAAVAVFVARPKPAAVGPSAAQEVGIQPAANLDVSILQYNFKSNAESSISLDLTGGNAKSDRKSITIFLESQGRLLMARDGSTFILQFRPGTLEIKDHNGTTSQSGALKEELAQATLFWTPGERPVLESDRPLQGSTMGVILQFVASLGPTELKQNPEAGLRTAQDLQKRCSWQVQDRIGFANTITIRKDQCRSTMSDQLSVELVQSQGEVTFQNDGNHWDHAVYSELSKAREGSNFISSNLSHLDLKRIEVDTRNLWRQPLVARIPLTPERAFAATPNGGVSTEKIPVDITEIQGLVDKLKSEGAIDDRAATERKFVHFVRQHPDQAHELLQFVEGLDSKHPLFRMVTVAFAEGRNAAAEKALIQLIDSRKQDAAATQVLFGAVAQMKQPGNELLTYTRERYQSSATGPGKDIAGLAMGGILQHMRDSNPERVQEVMAELQQELKTANTEQEKLLVLSIMGNAGVDSSLSSLLPYIQDSSSSLHAFAIQSLRFLRDQRSYEILLQQLASPNEGSRRAALLAVDFREASSDMALALKTIVTNPKEELGIRIMALEALGRKSHLSEAARSQLNQIDRNSLSGKLQKRFDEVIRSQP